MPTLVLLRHGQSQWNLENRFTGWVDVDLTDQGLAEAREAGALLRAAGLHFDAAHTSVLKRAIRTLSITMDALDQNWVPVTRSWRLNERHYGALQGLNKAETTEKHGEEQVTIWRRSYATPPPPMSNDDPGHPRNEARYAHLDPRVLPATESLATTLERVLPYWHDVIAPQLRAGQTILVTAHGNSLRALYKYLLNVAESDIVGVNIPTGVPLKFELNQELEVTDYGYLGDAQAAAAKAAAVANQAKA